MRPPTARAPQAFARVPPPEPGGPKRLVRLSAAPPAAAALLAGVAFFTYWFSRPSVDRLVGDARAALSAREFAAADGLAAEALSRSPGHPPALLVAAESAARQGRVEDALDFYRRLPDGGADGRHADAFMDAGDLALKAGLARDAEGFFHRASAASPRLRAAHQRLAALLVAEGRRWESAPHLFELVRQQRFSVEDLALLGNLDELYDGTELLRFFERAAPDDPVPLLGLARLSLHKSETAAAERLLRRIVKAEPALAEAQANYGKLLADAGRKEEFLRWHAALPPTAEEHPSIWSVRAAFVRARGDEAGAIRCYWEAVRRDPNHRSAVYQLSALLGAAGEDEASRAFAERAERLEALAAVTYAVLMDGPNAEKFAEGARLTAALGRPWEAWAWNLAVTVHFPDRADEARAEAERIGRTLGPSVPRTLDSANLARRFDLSRYPLPDWDRFRGDGSRRGGAPGGGIAFEDSAASVGLDVRYANGTDGAGMRIFQSVGGGLAVADFDADGRPDFYFPQAGVWPPRADDATSRDQMFLNRGGRFEDATAAAGLGDPGFGLGAGIGDVNADGLPDVYVANLGRNRLYLNNGDGTFADATDAAGLAAEQWTSCGLVADLTGDGLPDLYDVNYCAGREPLERDCANKDAAAARTCKPTLFRADPDRLLVNRGDGTFDDATERCGLADADGRGLGVVAFDPAGSGRLNLFVANDMTANFYLVNETPGPGAEPKFREAGVVSGLAYDFDGRPQACMGVAADDADGDGRLDLFVTNFLHESNTFYRQEGPDLFVDESRAAGLRDPSIDKLGFGTQFLDADSDGRPDLVVANGHIDDFSKSGMPFRMKPQFFRNEGGRFKELAASTAGPYFGRELLGRGLVRLDWNRDGREDFAVSHLLDPVALLTNRTAEPGRSVGLRLVGTASCRDAIGATVRATVGGRTVAKQLTAGDGYQCSNQRQLVFGLAEAEAADEVVVRWPSGREESFGRADAGSDFVLIEGRGRAERLPRSAATPVVVAGLASAADEIASVSSPVSLKGAR